MSTNIDHKDILDVRDLADLAIEQKDILEDLSCTEDDAEEATETLKALAGLLADLGQSVDDPTDAQKIADEFWGICERSNPTLIAEDYFVEAIESDFNDMYGLPNGLPGYVVVDWKATAENAKQDYSKGTLDEKVYFIRLG
jgi:hypothetical protein